MSDNWKDEQVKQIESKITELQKVRAKAFGRKEAAEQAAQQARGEVEAADQHIAQAQAELEAAKAAQ